MSKTITLRCEYSPKQLEILQSQARFRVGMMGRRFGKNVMAVSALLDYAYSPDTYPYGADSDPIVWWVGNTYTQTRKYGFEKVVQACPDSTIHGEPKRSAPFEISLRQGGQIEFYSYDRPESLQGAGVDLMIIDEAAYLNSSIWENDLRPMLLDNDGGALLISKPVGENWFYDRYCWGAEAGMPHAQSQKQKDDWFSVHATSSESHWIDADEVERIKETTADAVFRQQYQADPSSGGTLLTLDMLDTVPVSVLDGVQWQWHISVDLGVEMDAAKAREQDTDYWSIAIVAEHPTKTQAYLTEVRRRRGQAPSEAADWIKGCIEWVPTNEVVYERVQAQAWFEENLRASGLEPIPHTPTSGKEDRIIGLSVPFANGAVKLLDWSDVAGKDMDWSAFKTEWAGFPSGKVDQLDSVAQALDSISFAASPGASGLDMYDRGT
jgi:Terminase-like family.